MKTHPYSLLILFLSIIFAPYPSIVHAAAGDKKWEFKTGDSILSSPAVGHDGTVYVGSDDGKLYAIRTNGTQKWAFETGGSVQSSPAVGADGTTYVGSDDRTLYAISGDGTQKWAFETGGIIFASPAVDADGNIYVGSHDFKLYAIKPDGTAKWTNPFETGGEIHSSAAIDSGGIIHRVGGRKTLCHQHQDLEIGLGIKPPTRPGRLLAYHWPEWS